MLNWSKFCILLIKNYSVHKIYIFKTFDVVRTHTCKQSIQFAIQSLYQSTSLSVSLFVCLIVCLFVCLFPNSSETANPSELKFWGNDSTWDWEGFRLKNIRIRRTVSRKIKKKLELVQCALYDLHTLHILFIPYSYYTPFIAKWVRCRNVNHVDGGSNPGWW